MFSASLFAPFEFLDLCLGAITLVLLLRSRSLAAYWPMLVVSVWQIIPAVVLAVLRAHQVLPAQIAYELYLYTYWIVFACAAFCSGLVTYTIFNEALRPLKGLQSLGRIMFRWILLLSLALTLSAASASANSYDEVVVRVVYEILRISSIVVLGLVAVVAATVRPLGLTFRSRIFGVSLGLCVVTCANIWTIAYIFHNHGLYNSSNLTLILASCLAHMIWVWYFAVPEPVRKFVLLPTTSPFHAWNLVSERMGYDPGYVAIGGVPPESFADAEREIFERIAAQDSGRSPRLTEVSGEASLPKGWSTATAEATERFSRAWDFRYEHEPAAQEQAAAHSGS